MFKPARLIWKKPPAPECVGDPPICSPTEAALDEQKRKLIPQATSKELEKFKSSNCYGGSYPFPDIFKGKDTDADQQPERLEKLQLKDEKGRVMQEDTMRKDAGTYFYKVKPGDTLDKIKARLQRYKELTYLQDIKDSSGLISFNIRPPRSLPIGEWIPVPSKEEKKEIPPQLFFNYCYDAITEMAAHPAYGRRVQFLIKKIGIKTLLAGFYAIACAESGDVNKLGTTAFHRYESGKGVFSYSMFHVLMDDVGKKALGQLKLTPGQTYDPKNAVKLCLAFLCGKYTPFFVQKFGDINLSFDDPKNASDFIQKYTGASSEEVKTKHSNYNERLVQSYAAAQDLLKTAKGEYETSLSIPQFPELQGEQVKMVSLKEVGVDLKKAIEKASSINAQQIGAQKLLNPEGVKSAISRITGYINGLSVRTPSHSDTIGVGVDRYSVFILFKRDKAEQQFFRLGLPDVVATEQSEQFLKKCEIPAKQKAKPEEPKKATEVPSEQKAKPEKPKKAANGDFKKSLQIKLKLGDKDLYIDPPNRIRKIQKKEEDKRVKELELPKVTETNIQAFFKAGKLQGIKDNNPHYYLEQIGESGGIKYPKAELLKSLYPHTKKLLEFLAEQFFNKFKKKLKVVSLLRTEEWLQTLLKNGARNVSKTSTHEYGCTFDISHGGMTATEKNFLAELLAKLEKGGYISGTQETGSPCFHIMDRFPKS